MGAAVALSAPGLTWARVIGVGERVCMSVPVCLHLHRWRWGAGKGRWTGTAHVPDGNLKGKIGILLVAMRLVLARGEERGWGSRACV